MAIAARTSVVGRRPILRPWTGYAVVWSGPYRPPAVREVRYSSTAVGEGAALGDGLTYVGVASGGGFEDQLYTQHARGAGLVDGKPAMVSPVYGGNATVAWEPAAGLVAYVGYSGTGLGEDAVAALRRLANRTRALTRTEWLATRPQALEPVN